jgi:plasmid maintenance system killer protein
LLFFLSFSLHSSLSVFFLFSLLLYVSTSLLACLHAHFAKKVYQHYLQLKKQQVRAASIIQRHFRLHRSIQAEKLKNQTLEGRASIRIQRQWRKHLQLLIAKRKAITVAITIQAALRARHARIAAKQQLQAVLTLQV